MSDIGEIKNSGRATKRNEIDKNIPIKRERRNNRHEGSETESQSRYPTSIEEVNVKICQEGMSKRKMDRKLKKKNPSVEITEKTSSARRNRREKLEHSKYQGLGYSSNTTISTVLGDLGDEVHSDSSLKPIESDGDGELIADSEITLAPPPLKNISNRLYVEQINNKKFSTYDLEDQYDDEYENLRSDNDKPVKIAIIVQKLFRPQASLCCGLLGGISLWQCLIMQYWSVPVNDSDLNYIPDHSRHLQSLFYLLGTISFVSALDSCDLGHLNERSFRRCFPCRKAPLFVVAVLMLTISVSLFGAPLDEHLALSVYYNESVSYKMNPTMVGWDIEWWLTMNAARCVGGLIAWLLFSLFLGPDTLKNHLISLIGQSKHNEEAAKKAEKQNNTAK